MALVQKNLWSAKSPNDAAIEKNREALKRGNALIMDRDKVGSLLVYLDEMIGGVNRIDHLKKHGWHVRN